MDKKGHHQAKAKNRRGGRIRRPNKGGRPAVQTSKRGPLAAGKVSEKEGAIPKVIRKVGT